MTFFSQDLQKQTEQTGQKARCEKDRDLLKWANHARTEPRKLAATIREMLVNFVGEKTIDYNGLIVTAGEGKKAYL